MPNTADATANAIHMTRVRILFLVLIVIAFLLASRAEAQSSNDFQPWTAVSVTGPVTDTSRLLLWFDGHARMRDDASELGVTILRPGIGWRLNEGLDVWLGYARVTSHVPGPNVGEDRIWQQATYPIATPFGGTLSGRTRIEQRFRGSGGTGHRLRQALRFSKPLGNGPVAAVLANELFLNINDTDWGQASGQTSGFDQNRLFIGAAISIGERARLETGYLHNRLRGDRTNQVFSAAVFFGL